jgi:hypothetical protein
MRVEGTPGGRASRQGLDGMTAHALLSHQSIRRKRERGSHPELDEAAAAGIHGSSAVHLSTTAIVVAVLEHIAALAGYALRGFQHGGRLP